MKTIFDKAGQLNFGLFEPRLLQQTDNLQQVLAAAGRTQSSKVESTHFLIALIGIPGGLTQEFFHPKIARRDLEQGLAGCAIGEPGSTPPRKLALNILDDSARQMVTALDKYLASGETSQVDEGYLLLAALEHLTPAVAENLALVQLIPQDLIAELRPKLTEYVPPVLFDGQAVRQDAFSPAGRRVIELMKTEAEAMGYSQMDPRHLLLALLECEGGATQTALYQQNLSPKKIQERVMINLQAQAQKKRSQLDLHRSGMNASVIRLLDLAAEEAARPDRSDRIAEVHLLRAFLRSETFALRQLADAGVDVSLAREAARQFKPEDEAAPTIASETKSLETIKAELEAALVGQQDVIDICLPFIRRMLFSFRRRGKPAGVLLFCGPSGSGKTEMAKAIARAVFGGEENLIMLEMGQFQTKESMNIFVGAPPGYIGYGEGKLTNGLRDKPRSVVLFDEVEKAHPQVFDALLRFIDEGQIDDPAGPIRDGSECIIVMTSNVRIEGAEQLIQHDSYQKNKWEIRRQLKDALLNLPVESKAESERDVFRFRPEFLNRIDEIILFRALSEDDLTEIARRHIAEYVRRLKEEKQVYLTFGHDEEQAQRMEASAAKLIGHFCAGLSEGARATLRVTQSAVVDPIIDFIYHTACAVPVTLGIQVIPDATTHEPRGEVEQIG